VIASLVWKEYREHRSVWVALVLLTVVSLVVATPLLMPQGWAIATEDAAVSLVSGALILTGMYGLVCGAMMFAGERESQGMGFLVALPLGRIELWWAKCVIGVVFVLLYTAVVAATGRALGLLGPGAIPLAWAVALPVVGLEAFAWGLCASTFSRTVLTAVALAALVPLPLMWLISGMCLATTLPHGQEATRDAIGALAAVFGFHAIAALVALGVSLGAFADPDFEKRFTLKPTRSSYGTVAPKRQPRRYEVLLWLAVRQGVVLAVVLCVLGFLLGIGLPSAGMGLWPAATLFLGVACGAAVFLGEQSQGAFKFWGDQRLPAGWLWLRRSALWAGVGAFVVGLMLVGALLGARAQGPGLPRDPAALLNGLLDLPPDLCGPSGPFLFLILWPAYGFAFGQLCALVWRKSAVAIVVAVMTGAGTASLWVPSLLGGGLHALQVLGVPLLLLGACRLALWDWVTDQLRTRPAVARLVGGVVLASAWLAGNFTLRVVEAPAGGEPFDRAALRLRIADPEEGKAGLKIRDAVNLLEQRARPAEANRDAPAGMGVVRARPAVPALGSRDDVSGVIEHGWKAATPEFQRWLDKMTADPWTATLTEGARMPPGVLIHPTTEATRGRTEAADCRRAGEVLTARALWNQARGSDAVALDQLVTVLALSRHLRHQAPGYAYLEGVETERIALVGLNHWLEGPGRQPKLLRRALDELKNHESAAPPVGEALAVEYMRFRGELDRNRGNVGPMNGQIGSLLVQVPWEAERAWRLTEAVFAGRRRLAEAGEVVPLADNTVLADWLPEQGGASRERLEGLVASSWLADSLPVTAPLQRAAQMGLCRVRAARLLVALALYQAEHGKAAASLDDLVPALLPELPEDPFAHQAFRYRVSQGERIAWRRRLVGGGEEFVRPVPAGQGILWSVGPDGTDEGGARQWDGTGGVGQDVIFLVPR
jgi:hypothetical protein